jgi:glucose dehydrogenase
MAKIQRRQFIRDAAVLSAGTVAATALTRGGAAEATAQARQRCDTPASRDFPKVGGNLGNQNYSALDRIRPADIRRLGAAWVNRIEGGVTTGNNESTAVAVDGVIYIESAPGNVFAVDGRTGVTRWV